MRRELDKLVRMLVRVPGIKDVGLTTNGVLLADHAGSLFEAGLRRINISLDTLDKESFAVITRRDMFDQVMKGIESAARGRLREDQDQLGGDARGDQCRRPGEVLSRTGFRATLHRIHATGSGSDLVAWQRPIGG